jgi:ferredoxin-type protein NapG
MKVTRRDTLRHLAVGATCAAVGGLVHLLQRSRLTHYPLIMRQYEKLVGLLRPPGALPESDFLGACIRCYRCQDACQSGAIQFYGTGYGELWHTPYVDPAKKGCSLCGACGRACPTDALRTFNDRSGVDMGSVELSEDLCLSYKAQVLRDEQDMLRRLGREPTESSSPNERRGPCGECFMFCPLRGQAITLRPGSFLAPVIHVEHCAGCGMCEEICRQVVRGEPAIRVVRTRLAVSESQEAAS